MNDTGQITSLRNARKPGHFWVDNEVVDNYQTIVGADAVWVYSRIARYAHGAWIVSPRLRGAADTRVGLREMAEWCGKSVDTVWRCLEMLKLVGLIRSEGGARSRGRYALADVKELVLGQGGVYDAATGSVLLPAQRVIELRAQVKELRVKLARKAPAGGGTAAGSAPSSVAQSDSSGGELFVVPAAECDSSVAPAVQNCRTGSTAHLLLQDSKTARQENLPQPHCCATGSEGMKGETHAGEETNSTEALESAIPGTGNLQGHAEGLAVARVGAADRPGDDLRRSGQCAAGGNSERDAQRIAPIDAAVNHVCRELGFTAKRLKRKLRDQVVLRVELGEHSGDVAERMIASYRKLEKNARLLFRVPTAAEFYETGLWLDANRWNWDQTAIREEQAANAARVGSF